MPVSSGMAAQAIPLPFTDFHGGLNTRDQPYLLTQDQARDLNNLQGTAAGALVKRNGFQTLATPAVTFTSLFALESTSPTVLVGAGGTAIYSVTAGGTVTSIGTGFTSNKRWECVSGPVSGGQGPLFMMNGTDTPQYWTGSGSVANWTATDAGRYGPERHVLHLQPEPSVRVGRRSATRQGCTGRASRILRSGIRRT